MRNRSLNNFGKDKFNTSENLQNEKSNKFPNQIVDKLRTEYDRIMGEPDFVAVKLFSLEYPEYSERKFK